MRELRVARAFTQCDHVADGGDAIHVRAVVLVDFDVLLLQFDAEGLDSQSLGHRAAASRYQQVVGFETFGLAARARRINRDHGFIHDGLRHLRAGVGGNSLLLERPRELCRDRIVLDRHQARQQLDDCHFAAEAVEDRRELHADGAAAEDHDSPGHLFEVNRLVARDDSRVIDRDARHASRRRARRDDDVLRLQRLLVAARDRHGTLTGQPRGPFDPYDAVLLEQALDTPGQARDDLVLAGVYGGDVELRLGVAQGNAPFGGALNNLQRVRMFEKRLGRNTPPDQARAAERFLPLDHGSLETKLRGTNGRNVTAGTGADHDEVVGLRQERALLTRVSLSA